MQIFIRTLTGKTLTIDCNLDDTVLELKKKVEEMEGIPFEYQKFVYQGKELQYLQTLQDYNILPQQTINLVQRFPGCDGSNLLPTLNFVEMKNILFKGFSSEAPK